jgi:Protein of unknown function (DUF2934)
MNRFTTADVFRRVSRSSRMSSMAKRTPRTEADDTTTASANSESRTPGARPASESRQSTGAGRNRAARDTQATATEESTQQSSDTFAARSQSDAGSREYAPSEEEIRYRAYLLYIERGGGHGMDFEDWLQAERELKTRNR